VLVLPISSQDHISSNHSAKREPASREAAGVGKKDIGKSSKKAGMLLLHLVFWFCSNLFS
jgi:hypothetical protein